MIRLGMMLAAVLLMATAGNPIRAKITMQTFPVSAGAGAHDASRAGRHSLVVRRKRDREIRDVVWRRSPASPRHRSL